MKLTRRLWDWPEACFEYGPRRRRHAHGRLLPRSPLNTKGEPVFRADHDAHFNGRPWRLRRLLVADPHRWKNEILCSSFQLGSALLRLNFATARDRTDATEVAGPQRFIVTLVLRLLFSPKNPKPPPPSIVARAVRLNLVDFALLFAADSVSVRL